MPPRSPLPQRHGLDAAWLRTPNRVRGVAAPWLTMADWLRERLPVEAEPERLLCEQRFVYFDGGVVQPGDAYHPHTFIWFHRELREEVTVPGVIQIVHRDERIIVVDKPAFLSSIPRGKHVLQSAVVRLRQKLGLPELTPAHRLDRVTSGLLLFTTEKRWRSAYQTLFQEQTVYKVYRALAPIQRDLELPQTVMNHIHKVRGIMQAHVIPGKEPNSRSLIELETDLGTGVGSYRLTPTTGRTHQLRLHMNSLGIPILNDPLYPVDADVDIDDFSSPLQLLASELAFTDPIDGTENNFVSGLEMPLTPVPTNRVMHALPDAVSNGIN